MSNIKLKTEGVLLSYNPIDTPHTKLSDEHIKTLSNTRVTKGDSWLVTGSHPEDLIKLELDDEPKKISVTESISGKYFAVLLRSELLRQGVAVMWCRSEDTEYETPTKIITIKVDQDISPINAKLLSVIKSSINSTSKDYRHVISTVDRDLIKVIVEDINTILV